ncbi:MAG: heparinase II/III family protein, partial [Phycisphaerae bacterium]
AAHNTVVVDNTDQSEMLGLFLWGRRANAVCTEFLPDAPRPRIAAQHDGYMRLADPVRHQRTLTLDPGLRRIVIEDLLDCVGNHEVALYFHCAESCTVKKIAERAYRLDADVVIATFQMDERLTTSLFHGSETTKLGWVSRGYHVRSAASTLVATGTIQGTTLFRTEIVLDETTDSISLHERKQTVGTTVAD